MTEAHTSFVQLDSRSRSIWRLRWRRFIKNRPAALSLMFLVLLCTICFMAAPYSWIRDIDATTTNLLARFQPPSSQHWLGTDQLGRDLLLRLMYGGQVSLAVGVFATLLTAAIGVFIGLWAGFLGGRTDSLLMRVTDIVIALPMTPVLIVLGAVDLVKLGLDPELAATPAMIVLRIVIIIALVDWTTIARITRAETMSVRQREYIKSASVSGAGHVYNVIRHVLPNVTTPITVAATLSVGRIILFESMLSFLGFGIVPPVPTWGNMLTNAQQLLVSAPVLAVYPGMLIFMTVMAVNFVGDGIRNAFDPRSEQ